MYGSGILDLGYGYLHDKLGYAYSKSRVQCRFLKPYLCFCTGSLLSGAKATGSLLFVAKATGTLLSVAKAPKQRVDIHLV